MPHTFPPGFVWGAATSGYQIEGARAREGRFDLGHLHSQSGPILHGDTGDIACDAYDVKQPDADLALICALGLSSYTFSLQYRGFAYVLVATGQHPFIEALDQTSQRFTNREVRQGSTIDLEDLPAGSALLDGTRNSFRR